MTDPGSAIVTVYCATSGLVVAWTVASTIRDAVEFPDPAPEDDPQD
jgi:hypothetical protein